MEIKKRCRFCLGLLKVPSSRDADEVELPDPVCTRPHHWSFAHHWTTMVNPPTNFFRWVIKDFWATECAAYAAVAGKHVAVADLPVIELHLLRQKLDEVLKEKATILEERLGIAITLSFNKPGQ